MRPDSTCKQWIRYLTAVAIGVFFLPSSRLDAQQKHKAHPAQKHTVHRNIKSKDQPVKRHYTHHSAHKATRHHYAHHQNTGRHKKQHYYRHSKHHHHLGLVRLQPDRIKEIQQALVGKGYLQDPPTGKWDATTRDAMRRYQAANGFKPTGLPEAKPLMKLGLGPHPLPPGLEPLRSASASMPGETEASATPSALVPAGASNQAQ